MEGSMSEEQNTGNETVVENPETKTTESAEGKFVAESKKYRLRAQEAESRVAELEAEMEKAEDAKLAENEEFKTLYEKANAELETTKGYEEKYNTLVQTQKDKLLEQLPEDSREKFANKDLETIEFVVGQLNSKPAEPEHRGGVGDGLKITNMVELANAFASGQIGREKYLELKKGLKRS